MHPEATVASVLALHEAGLNNCEIARRTGVPRPTVKDWVAGRVPRSYRLADPQGLCEKCGGGEHRFDQIPEDYVYLLGLYLGDGTLSEPRQTGLSTPGDA
jgi:hypothetical protein